MKRLIGATALMAAAAICVLSEREAAASGFAIRENSAEALGTAFAGNASSATFLSTIFNNPAGMTEFTGDRAQVDASLVLPSLRFEGSASQNFPGPVTIPISGVGSGNAGQAAFIPALYVFHSITDDLKVGFALTVPFGLSTIYPENWVGRYFGIRSNLQTLDLNPNIAYRVNNWISVGAGFSVQYLYADLTQALDFIRVPDGRLRVHGDDWAIGGNAGVLLKPWDATNIGVTYRSRIEHTISGTADFTGIPGPGSFSLGAKAPLTTPDSVDLSITQKITDKLRIAGDLQWTNWSVFKSLAIHLSNGVVSTTPENFKNTWFVSVGGTYNLDDNWTFRVGTAYDKSPVTDGFRTVRLPDSDRYWLAFGAGYKFSDGFSVDVGVAHIFMRDASITNSVNSTIPIPPLAAPVGTAKIVGKYQNQIDLISLQTRFKF